MVLPFQFVTRVFVIFLLLGLTAAADRGLQAAPNSPVAPGSTPPKAAPQAPDAPAAQNPPAQPAAPQIDTAEIVKRANQDVGANIDAKVAGWQKQLDRIEGELRRKGLRYNELNALRDELQGLRANVSDFWTHVQRPLDAVQAQVDKLGSPPAAGQPPEPEQAATRRAELNYHLGLLAAARKSIDAAHFRINQLIDTIQDIRRTNFTNNLFQPVPGVFSRQTWETVPGYAESALDKARSLVMGWWNNLNDKADAARIALEAAAMWFVLTLLAWWGVRRLWAWKGLDEPPFWKRASSAAGVILLRVLPGVVPLVFLYNALAAEQPFPQGVDWLFYVAARSLIIIFSVDALIRTVFAPTAPHWRLIPASDWAAARMWALILTLAAVYGLTTLIYATTRIVQSPFSLTVAVTLPASLIFAGLVIAILRTPLHEKHLEGLPSLTWMKALRLPVWLIAFAIIVTALAGYLALSRFMAQQLLVTGSILALVYLLLLWVDGIAQGMGDEHSASARWLKEGAGLDQRRREQLAVPVSLLLKFAILVFSVPLILLQWGYPWADILEWYRQLFFGFQIGNTQVSLGAIFAAIIVFVLGYFAARFFQSWLDAQILKPAGLSGGLRDSIRTGVGYLGVFAAALIAFSYAGFNLSSLAIVAGAFSVGIGFGLQSVVSNFVSGLILLAERPIKVGDLVVVGGEEGYVRKISVRSTEIETFDRANVLIPNSFFITEKVKNWTLRNNTGRIVIPVGVAYGCDPRKVKAILLKVAKDHLNVMTTPEPFVDFEDFGEDSLSFKLYAFIHDLTKSSATRTDLRMSILDAFNEAGIVIPSRQTDVTLRDIDWLRDAVTQYMANGFDGKASGKGSNLASIPAREPADG